MALFTLGGLGARPVLADCLGGAPNGVVEAGEQCDDGNLANDDGCTYQCVTPPNCIDDVTGVVNNCTANDVRISLVLNREDVACEMGSMVELDLTAVLVANASERWDIGTFIALDGGNARSGACRQGYLPPPLAAAGSCAISGGVCNNNLTDNATGCPASGLCSDGVTGCNVDLECPPAPGGTCFVTGEACMADAECPGNGIEINNPCVGACAGGQACIGGYDPTDGFAPFFNGEDLEDPADLCGDLEQGVYTYQEIGFITIPCVDNDGDGKVDIGSCVSWDNNREKTCLGKEDAIP
ncbi:MAG TPA: hypothetical protein PK313_05135, partial [Myxococcota bacterium]|nr:hypothetical protein [Myxococcota bacterium]